MDSLKEKIQWTTQTRKISDLIPAEYNPRQITEKQATELKASLDKFSLADPLVINANNKIIGGHQRFFILKAAGEDFTGQKAQLCKDSQTIAGNV